MLVVKVGGGKDINWDYIAQDLKKLQEKLVVVHGANYLMDQYSRKLKLATRTIVSPSGHSSRYTDHETIDLMLMVYSGLANKKIVVRLLEEGLRAVGLSGVDGALWQGERKKTIYAKEGEKIMMVTDSQTGKVTKVNTELLNILLAAGYTPVVTGPAVSAEHVPINVDNDRAAAVVATAIGAQKMVILLEAAGILRDITDPRSKLDVIKVRQIDELIDKLGGRIAKKLLGIKEAIAGGVEKVYLYDGRAEQSITAALEGKGTIVEK